MKQLVPERTTTLPELGIQFFEGVEHAILSIEPDTSPAVLNALFDNAFFPSPRPVRIKQTVRTHPGKPSIDRAALTLVDLIDSGLHVVVDAATLHPTYRDKRAGMGIEQHLVALAGICNQPECTTGAQLHAGVLDASKQAADQQDFFTLVELKDLTECKRQRYKGP